MKAKMLIIIPMLFSLGACQKSSSSKPKSLTTERSALESDITYAGKLTRVGEILINNPLGIVHANDLFNKALNLDPTNNKALFYSAFTEILMAFEGAAERTKSMHSDPEDYKKFVNKLTNELKYPEFINFVIGKSNQSEIKNIQELKRFFQTEIINAFEKAGEKFEKITGDVDLILSNYKSETNLSYTCTTTETPEGSITTCESATQVDGFTLEPAQTYKVDHNDIKILAGGLKGYSTVLKLYTGYKLDGQEQIQDLMDDLANQQQRELTEKETHNIVRKFPNYLTLEKDQKISETVEDMESIVLTGMDLEALNNKFCDNELRENNLIKTICFGEEARLDMQKVLDSLYGPQEQTLGLDKNGNEVKILVDIPAFLRNPVEDLKSLLPTSYNSDGSSRYTTMPSLNGLFPNGDLLEKLQQVVSE